MCVCMCVSMHVYHFMCVSGRWYLCVYSIHISNKLLSFYSVTYEKKCLMELCACRYASSVDAALEEEEQYADQLKEYYAFGDSLR